METKWTPGPWRYDRTNGSPTTGEHMIAGAKPGYLAEVRDCGSGDVRANAHLIAAAPDMAPLVEVLASLPIGPNTADNVPLYGLDGVYITHGHVRAARAALAKARGEA